MAEVWAHHIKIIFLEVGNVGNCDSCRTLPLSSVFRCGSEMYVVVRQLGSARRCRVRFIIRAPAALIPSYHYHALEAERSSILSILELWVP